MELCDCKPEKHGKKKKNESVEGPRGLICLAFVLRAEKYLHHVDSSSFFQVEPEAALTTAQVTLYGLH